MYWNASYSLDEVAGALHAVECAVAEVDVCLRIGTELGLGALLEALGYDDDAE